MNQPIYVFIAAAFAYMFLAAIRSSTRKKAWWKDSIAVVSLLAAVETMFLGMKP